MAANVTKTIAVTVVVHDFDDEGAAEEGVWGWSDWCCLEASCLTVFMDDPPPAGLDRKLLTALVEESEG